MSNENTETTTEETETTTDTSGSPWESDLENEFEDPAVRKAVSDFLGSKVQPYVTKIEQEARPSRDATRLWDGFEKQPIETSIQVVKELYGAEIGDKFAELLQGGSSEGEAAAQIQKETDVDVSDTTAADETTKEGIKFDDLPDEVREAVIAQQQEKQREAYYNEVERIRTERADDLPKEGDGDDAKAELDVDLFHPFVVAAEGDFDKAADAFLKFQEQAKEKFGVQVPSTDDVEVPPVVNSETRDAGAKPPQSKEGQTLDEAMDDFFSEQKSPPPTVGSA